MDTRTFLLVLTVVIAVYVTVSSATQTPKEEDSKAVQLPDQSQAATAEKNGDETPSVEGKKGKPKRKHHNKKNHRHHTRPRSHGGRNRTRSHKNQRHGAKDKLKKKNQESTPLPHEDSSVKSNEQNTRQERNHKKEKKNRSRSREGRNRNPNHNERDGNHPIQNDGSTSINNPVVAETVYQPQKSNHNLVGHSTKTAVKEEPTKATSTASNSN